jgi:hypothetical protein
MVVPDSPDSKNKSMIQGRSRVASTVVESAEEEIKTLSKMQTRE